MDTKNSHIMKNEEFKDKVVLITGSSRGIGKATAVALSNLGASLVINGRDKERLIQVENLIKNSGGKVMSYCCDITNPDQVEKLIEETIKTYGKLDILINNAGVSMRGDFSDLNPEVFKSVFDINVLGTTNTTIKAIPFIKKSQGSIVFVSSVAGIRGLPSNSAYCASKMALRAIAESIRIEEVKSNIHVGLIMVGITEIEKNKKTIGADGSLITLKDRSNFKVLSLDEVAYSIINNIKKRKFRTTLSLMGRINAFMQSILPDLVERILVHSSNRIKARSL
jgi:short-subunit dehydrogenase